jgi:hypothetical protein
LPTLMIGVILLADNWLMVNLGRYIQSQVTIK